jgi:hypothetical protein
MMPSFSPPLLPFLVSQEFFVFTSLFSLHLGNDKLPAQSVEAGRPTLDRPSLRLIGFHYVGE